ncbi:MAG: thioredoxin domain-containing protein [Candidatus Zixiibacteriota bacterium]
MPQYTNRLAQETSPYLQQHAHNPVDWYPWGEEALNKARSENKPIFLSIGYSACHWCHVMERESFENDSTAAIMNRQFVNIKVDREERPDLDDIYMSFVQMSTGSGGWPMSVFLTPEGKPFFGGTYFPPEEAFGRPGFPQLLEAVADAWDNDREGILHGADTAVERLKSMLELTPEPAAISPDAIDTAIEQMLQRFDPINGGFSGAPKFPPSYALSTMMRQYYRTQEPRILKAITFTLDKMAQGGIYDQLGGGFHRYSVDAQWLVPHFEKMLYDNALLTVTYCDAYQLTKKPLYKLIATEILDFVLRDMTDATGAFHSAEDADSEGEEGKFYVWTAGEVVAALGEEDAKMFCDYYDVSTGGNFEHQKSILHARIAPEEFASRYSLTPDELQAILSTLKEKLLKVRSTRIRPSKDDKVLTDWNGLMISAFARGYQISAKDKYLLAAQNCASYLKSTLYSKDGLKRVYRAGFVKQHGFITDYAFLLNGLVDLYESDFDIAWLEWANYLALEMLEKFSDKQSGGFFMTIADQDDLLVRQKDSYDGAIPSGSSVAAMALLRLGLLLDNREFRSAAEKTIALLAANANKVPMAYMNLLNAADFMLHQPREIAVVGKPNDPATKELIREIYSTYLPNRVIALLIPAKLEASTAANLIPLLRERAMIDGKPAAYVCENFTCRLPVTSSSALAAQLRQ